MLRPTLSAIQMVPLCTYLQMVKTRCGKRFALIQLKSSTIRSRLAVGQTSAAATTTTTVTHQQKVFSSRIWRND